jgi:NET1-associated nuclear protein 1 (U3 small nucleolar RNA-associated protein 17)
MSTNPELNLRKRRGDGPNHQPNKKVKHVASASASRGLQITQEGQQDESTKQKPEELALNGKSIVEGKQDIKKKKSKQKRNKEDVPNVQGLEERELEKNEISPPQNGITPKQKKKGKEFVGEDTIKAVNSIHARSSKDRKVRLKGPMKEFSWSISQPLGGCFVPLDPVFSVDEKYDI